MSINMDTQLPCESWSLQTEPLEDPLGHAILSPCSAERSPDHATDTYRQVCCPKTEEGGDNFLFKDLVRDISPSAYASRLVAVPDKAIVPSLKSSIKSHQSGDDGENSPTNTKGIYFCLRCGTGFKSRRSNVAAHIREVHLQLRKDSCQFCSYRSNRTANLARHVKSKHPSKAPTYFQTSIF